MSLNHLDTANDLDKRMAALRGCIEVLIATDASKEECEEILTVWDGIKNALGKVKTFLRAEEEKKAAEGKAKAAEGEGEKDEAEDEGPKKRKRVGPPSPEANA